MSDNQDVYLSSCTQCNHTIRHMGADWLCTNGCRCTMRGCVPRSPKYGTDKDAPQEVSTDGN